MIKKLCGVFEVSADYLLGLKLLKKHPRAGCFFVGFIFARAFPLQARRRLRAVLLWAGF